MEAVGERNEGSMEAEGGEKEEDAPWWPKVEKARKRLLEKGRGGSMEAEGGEKEEEAPWMSKIDQERRRLHGGLR